MAQPIKQILIIKTSSMGDIIHNFPLVHDLSSKFPSAKIDWIVEENFKEVIYLNKNINKVIPIAFRRWRKFVTSGSTWREIGDFLNRARTKYYDAIIDSQGLLKSAIVASMCRGKKYGLNWASSREPIGCFYNKVFDIPRIGHAIDRNRKLGSLSLQYETAGPPENDLQITENLNEELTKSIAELPPKDQFAILIPSASKSEKQWPQASWVTLANKLKKMGLISVIPFYSNVEKKRAIEIAEKVHGAIVPPRLRLDLVGALLSNSRLVVGVDTGLTHLANALKKNVVGIFCSTDPNATGLVGGGQVRNLGGIGRKINPGEVLSNIHELIGRR